jgi:hypothetical protein
MGALFDPSQLDPKASLNRSKILALPGVEVPGEWVGKSGFEVASAKALSRLIRERADALELTHAELTLPDRDLPPCLNLRLGSASTGVARAANEIAREFISGVGYLVLSLTRSYSTGLAIEDEWEREYRKHWGTIRTIVFGGGLLSGRLGARFTERLSDFWAAQKFPPMKFAVAPSSNLLALIGAGRSVEDGDKAVLAFDFGGSFVKRALFSPYMTILRPLATPAVKDECNEDELRAVGQMLFDFMAGTIGMTWLKECDAGGRTISRVIPVSVASYMYRGQPIERQGGPYSMLNRVSADVSKAMSQAVSARVGTDVEIRLMHDGTAAAMGFAGLANAAVITLGSALGVGFPP